MAGCLLIDSKVLKTRLAPVVTDTASDIKDVLTIIARNECLRVAEELQKRNAVLTARPEDLDGFMAYRVAHTEQFTERQAALLQMEKVRYHGNNCALGLPYIPFAGGQCSAHSHFCHQHKCGST